jgi:hypothetical protein
MGKGNGTGSGTADDAEDAKEEPSRAARMRKMHKRNPLFLLLLSLWADGKMQAMARLFGKGKGDLKGNWRWQGF